ncbi:hypothetical protein GO755_10440 [Spirosoma sp. HMF4905]|uniref:Uncharacterized protein n=1 Tax=Spirosoma arboris TaxID=2682092 RepID=A0A7K1S9D9_9BACT|nr:hypothetical protein [Spirosoma arboris]
MNAHLLSANYKPHGPPLRFETVNFRPFGRNTPKGIRVNGIAPRPIWTPLQVSGVATKEKSNSVR